MIEIKYKINDSRNECINEVNWFERIYIRSLKKYNTGSQQLNNYWLPFKQTGELLTDNFMFFIHDIFCIFH